MVYKLFGTYVIKYHPPKKEGEHEEEKKEESKEGE